MKKCFKCGQVKSPDLFYRHPMMADGRLGKCIECTKADTSKRIELKKLDPVWVAKERERSRIKAPRYRAFEDKEAASLAKKRWRSKNALKRRAHVKARRAVCSGIIKPKTHCEDCGEKSSILHKHHNDYSKPIDVTFLCTKCHGMRHRKQTFEVDKRVQFTTN